MRRLVSLLLTVAALGANAKPVKFGCAYYPEAWPEANWERDLRDMKDLGLSIVRVGEFNWSGFEPTEGNFDFAPYCRFLTLCEKVGMEVMMCTPTAALPPWMHAKYPETERVSELGRGVPIGKRQTRCPSRPKFRFFATRVTTEMAKAFKGFPCIRFWQIDNELHMRAGFDACCCPDCEAGFQAWLKRRYGTIDELNRAWNHAFWSARFTDWSEIRLPINATREPWRVEFAKFQSDVYVEFAREQADDIRAVIPGAVCTSNGSEMSGHLRLDQIYRGFGYAAIDTYISDSGEGRCKWMWGLSRGLTGRQKPFMVAEMGPFTWTADKTNGDEDLVRWTADAAAHGAEYILFFRWRQSVNGEQVHPAILPWSGRKGVCYDRVKRIVSRGLTVGTPASGVAILHSNESDQDTLVRVRKIQYGPYEDTHILLNSALEKRGILPDYLLSGDDVDFTPYRLVFVPVNVTVPKDVIAKLKEYVRNGGTVVAIARLNLLDPRGGSYFTEPYPVGLTDLFGLEINEQRAGAGWSFAYDLVEPKGCEVLASLKGGVFAGSPWITRMTFGRGKAYYVASLPQTDGDVSGILSRLEDGLTNEGK